MPNRRSAGIGYLIVLVEFQPKIVEVWLAHRVRPPEIGIHHRQLCELFGREADLPILAGRKGDRLLGLNIGLAGPRDGCPEDPTDILRGEITEVRVNCKSVSRAESVSGSGSSEFTSAGTEDHGARDVLSRRASRCRHCDPEQTSFHWQDSSRAPGIPGISS